MEELCGITPELIQHYIGIFDANEGVKEETLNRVFSDKSNGDIHTVLVKVTVLNAFYSTGILNTNLEAVARNIVAQHEEIDRLLAHESREYCLFNMISEIPARGIDNVYSFATKYLNFHARDRYPIMDSYARRMLNRYAQLYPWLGTVKNDYNYVNFCTAFDRFRAFVNVKTGRQYSVKELDKFLWQYGKCLDK